MTPRPVGLRLIIAYKLIKAVLQVCGAVALFFALRAGLAHKIEALALALEDHAVHPWTVHLARLLTVAARPRHLQILGLVLVADAVVSAAEGLLLRRGFPWAPWVVVGATGALLPVELVELIRRPRVGRFVLLAVNAAIVLYLAAKHRSAVPPPRPPIHVERPGLDPGTPVTPRT